VVIGIIKQKTPFIFMKGILGRMQYEYRTSLSLI